MRDTSTWITTAKRAPRTNVMSSTAISTSSHGCRLFEAGFPLVANQQAQSRSARLPRQSGNLIEGGERDVHRDDVPVGLRQQHQSQMQRLLRLAVRESQLRERGRC